jgi:hypothetical protein
MRARHPIAVGLFGLCVQALLLTPGVRAMPQQPLRNPQVSIVGGGLQAYLDSVGQSIHVNSDQADFQAWNTGMYCAGNQGLFFQLAAKPPGSWLGLYDAAEITPSFFEIFTPDAQPRWFTMVNFLSSPTRVRIIMFDNRGNPVGFTEIPGGNREAVAFYMEGPRGGFYTEDARNLSGDPQFLSFAGTGSNAFAWWIVGEETALSAGADRDFDDVIMFIGQMDCDLPIQRSTWGAVKSRFR